MVKYRQVPEDFVVEELNDFKIAKSGKYKLYVVEKKGIESFYFVSYLSKKFNIPNQNIGIGGLKDKHAKTKQFLTIPSKYNIDIINEDNLKVSFLGFVEKEIRPGDLSGNRFVITLRDIKKGELDGIMMKAGTISKIGVPNYFDSQRFGSVILKEFMAKYIVKGDYEAAVRIFLTEYQKSESKGVKNDKRCILEQWKTLMKVTVKTPMLQAVIDEYKKTGEFLFAYKKIPAKLREMYVSAYQSYVWNECVKALLWQGLNKKSLYSVDYACGTLVFYKSLDEKDKENIPKTFQLIGPDMKMTELETSILSKVLTKEGVTLSDFDIKEKVGNFFKPIARDIIIYPKEFSISKPQIDELNDKGKQNRFKISVSFTLQKGSYATVVTKRIFNQ